MRHPGGSVASVIALLPLQRDALRALLERKPAEPKHILTVRKTGYRFEP